MLFLVSLIGAANAACTAVTADPTGYTVQNKGATRTTVGAGATGLGTIGCAAGYGITVGTPAAAVACTGAGTTGPITFTGCATCAAVAGSTGTSTCAADKTKPTPAGCVAGKYAKVNANAAGTCAACAAITNAKAGVTCASATTSKAAGGCNQNYKKVTGTADTCVARTCQLIGTGTGKTVLPAGYLAASQTGAKNTVALVGAITCATGYTAATPWAKCNAAATGTADGPFTFGGCTKKTAATSPASLYQAGAALLSVVAALL